MSGTSVLVPLRIWLLPTFPDTPPLVYVVPRDNIKIKLGRNVYTSGKVRHRDIQRWRHVSHETPLFSKMATCHMIPLSIVISNYVDMYVKVKVSGADPGFGNGGGGAPRFLTKRITYIHERSELRAKPV